MSIKIPIEQAPKDKNNGKNNGTYEVPSSDGKSEVRVAALNDARLPNASGSNYIRKSQNFLYKVKNIDLLNFRVTDLALSLERIQEIKELSVDTKRVLRGLDIISIIANPAFLLYCYKEIKKRKNPVGIEDVIPMEMTSNGFIKLAKELAEGKYRPRPTKRINISGRGIASTKDKVVQQALLLVLSEIFEPIFLDESHGFRPGRSCHSALKEIQQK
jgi:retron-type reverse transcriptase